MTGLEGRTLDRYELRQFIGKGGMADVYLGYDTTLQRVVAVKVFRRDDEEMLRRFVREARLMQRLSHPHLMPVYDTGESVLDGVTLYYIVMPFMNGGTLRARIRNSPLSPVDACSYLHEIADALDYIHRQGIVHRDIKSSNVLLDAEGRPYLTDFGIARTTTDITQLTSTGNVLGTVDYVAPELFEPDHKANALSDLYSLGVLLFEMVTGRLPFPAENQIAVVSMHMTRRPPSPRSLVPTISPQVEQVIFKALSKRPEQRYRSAGELAEAFCQAAYAIAPVQEQLNVPVQEQRMGSAGFAPAVQAEANEPTIIRSVTNPPPVIKQPSSPRITGGYSSPRVVPPTPIHRPTPSRVQRPVSPARTRFMVSLILALSGLFALILVSVYAVLTHPVGQENTVVNVAASQTVTAAQATPSSTQIPTPDLTATAQAVASATQQGTNTTATAVVIAATTTAQAQTTATAVAIQTAPAGNSVYTDALNNPTNPATQTAQWDQSDNCAFKPDGYHVMVGTSFLGNGKLQGCLESGYQYTNFSLSVDLTIISGHTGGVFFRVGTKAFGAYSGYLFEIDNQGNYKISRSGNFSTGSGNDTFIEASSSILRTGTNAKNTLKIIAGANSISFYINNVPLTTWQDVTFTTGDIAFLATTSAGGANADMLYSNLKIYPQS